MKKDVEEFSRKLRLIEYFSSKNNSSSDTGSIVKSKSSFIPPDKRNKHLDTTINYLKSQNYDPKTEKRKSNISKAERKAMKELLNDKEIIIKEADKGGCVVIMNTSHYVNMVKSQLNDSTTYRKVKPNCDNLVMNKLTEFVKKYKNVLTSQESNYLSKFSYSTSNFYGLPKIHKSKIIEEAIKHQNTECINILEPIDLKLRPIIAGPKCPTRPLSNLIDILIKPLLLHVKSYIKDNIDFLQKCSRINSTNTVLATFDVTSLYTSIPHNYGLEAIKYWLDKYRSSVNPRYSTSFILEAITFILTNNNFAFDDEYCNQILGTAMGSIFAPDYAGLTVGYLEIKLYTICELKWGKVTMLYIYENWSRFLDDCHITLDTKDVIPEDLLAILNSINKNIQFTMDYSDKEIPFLDILIKRDDNIWMDLYHKPTDTQRYVSFDSNHPSHCKRNIPFTLARRICTIVENECRKTSLLDSLRKNLSTQKYPLQVINRGISKALSIPQNELRKPAESKEDNNILSFTTTYNPNNPEIFDVIKSGFTNLKNNKISGFDNLQLIHSRRQAPNLKRILTKAAFSTKEHRVRKCGDLRCGCCKHLILSDHFIFKNTGYRFNLKSSMSCDSSNLIYVVQCAGCLEEYIGETGEGETKLRDRVRVYRQHINDPIYQMLKVEGHIRICGKGKFTIFPFLQMRSQDTQLRRAFESKFQKQFKTKLNY